jgi:hypothetical protein
MEPLTCGVEKAHLRTGDTIMAEGWSSEFGRRMRGFEGEFDEGFGIALSIKVRVTSGCFHREHSPCAYEQIDAFLDAHEEELSETRFEEHESGPEVLVWLAVGTATLTLTKSVIELVIAIIKARGEGIKKGDHPSHPLELIVRRSIEGDKVNEEIVVRVDPKSRIAASELEAKICSSIQKLLEADRPVTIVDSSASPRQPKRKKGKQRKP